ncbi:MAG: hypothetical protein VXY77_02130 [Pseudomonadota bacterium]|nr:hypothetical protein [Pseudomonadota bacterium]
MVTLAHESEVLAAFARKASINLFLLKATQQFLPDDISCYCVQVSARSNQLVVYLNQASYYLRVVGFLKSYESEFLKKVGRNRYTSWDVKVTCAFAQTSSRLGGSLDKAQHISMESLKAAKSAFSALSKRVSSKPLKKAISQFTGGGV